MSEKLFDERGFLSEVGEKRTNKLRKELQKLINELPIEEIPLVGTILQKMVGDVISLSIIEKQQIKKQLDAMSDDEFTQYLSDKYLPLHGENWMLVSNCLTEEESARDLKSFDRKIKAWAQDKSGIKTQHYGLNITPQLPKLK